MARTETRWRITGGMVAPTPRAIIPAMSAIRVMHFGLGPIGAAMPGRWRRARASRSSAPSTSIRRRSAATRRRRSGCAPAVGVKVQRDAAKALQAAETRRRRALHELVARSGDAADRDDPEGEDADRLDHRGAVVSRLHARPRRRGRSTRWAKKAKVAVLGDRRQSRVRDGRAADHADRGLRAGRPRRRQPRAGRAHPPAAVPAEDRRRADDRAVPAEGRRRQRAARRVDRVDRDDRRRARAGRSIGSPTTSSRSSRR